MYNVSRISTNQIIEIRNQLMLAGLPNYVNQPFAINQWPNYNDMRQADRKVLTPHILFY